MPWDRFDVCVEVVGRADTLREMMADSYSKTDLTSIRLSRGQMPLQGFQCKRPSFACVGHRTSWRGRLLMGRNGH